MVELSAGLSPATLQAVADLERRVVAADGGRLKLGWSSLRHRPEQDVNDVLWWEGDRLVGFLGLYLHAMPTIELAGMVDPAARGRGIGAALLEAGLRLARGREHESILLIVPRPAAAGRSLAERFGGRLDHSEHALEMAGDPVATPADPRVTLRPATVDDQAAVREIMRLGFGWAPPESAEPEPHAFVVERDGRIVGTVRVHRDDDRAGIYGFAVHPDHQGRGIGRDVLHRVCRDARDDGAPVVHLEVETSNDRALNLYTSLGFRPVITEDYYALPDR